MRINRYIMECKCQFQNLHVFQMIGINRYIMECKFVSGCIAATLGPELIDTLWNVNFADGSVHGHSPL